MHNDKKDSNTKSGSLTSPKTNEDFNKKRPRIGDPGLKQNFPTKELPPMVVPDKEIDTEIRMAKPLAHNEGDLNQRNDFPDSETPIDHSDSLGVPITGKKASEGK